MGLKVAWGGRKAGTEAIGDKAMTHVGTDGLVRFGFYRPDVRRVAVVGDFSGWRDDGAVQMSPEGDGWWKAGVRLKMGEHRFRYVADGAGYTDYASNGIEVGKLGGHNSVSVVTEREVSTPEA